MRGTLRPRGGTIAFSGVQSLAGGTGSDTLSFDVHVTLTGSGATGYNGTADGMAFSGMNTLVGNGPADTLAGENAASTWTLGATQTYDDGAGHGALTFSGFQTLQGGSSYNDTFKLAGGAIRQHDRRQRQHQHPRLLRLHHGCRRQPGERHRNGRRNRRLTALTPSRCDRRQW